MEKACLDLPTSFFQPLEGHCSAFSSVVVFDVDL